jgi:hypothetical protein
MLPGIPEGLQFHVSFLIYKQVHGLVYNTYGYVLMILPQVHLRKPCYDFYFL